MNTATTTPTTGYIAIICVDVPIAKWRFTSDLYHIHVAADCYEDALALAENRVPEVGALLGGRGFVWALMDADSYKHQPIASREGERREWEVK